MKALLVPMKVLALGVVAFASVGATSGVSHRIHYLTESGNPEPGFPYPYVGYTDYYCDGSDVTYGLVTGNQEYQFISSC